jgi:nicotinamide riboside transporter PnuC
MFKFIGAAVVYGFATYGLFTWLQKSKKEDEEQVNVHQH